MKKILEARAAEVLTRWMSFCWFSLKWKRRGKKKSGKRSRERNTHRDQGWGRVTNARLLTCFVSGK